jgi:Na+(H+)/acetate symporter ActP
MKIINNMHVIDRAVRAILALAVIILYFMGQLSGAAAVILGIIAVIFLATACVGYCPLYQLLGISTKGK